MTQPFDFDKVGKRTPYRVPEGFFEDMQQQVMNRVEPRRRRGPLLWRISSAIVGVAAVVSALVFLPRTQTESQPASVRETQWVASNSWIEQLSDEDLEAMDELNEYDVFSYLNE